MDVQNQKITGVADGEFKSGSTEAVTAGQLYDAGIVPGKAADGSVAIGNGSTVTSGAWDWDTNTPLPANGVAIGDNAKVNGSLVNGVAIGQGAEVRTDNATAIGQGSRVVSGDGSVALGQGSMVTAADAKGTVAYWKFDSKDSATNLRMYQDAQTGAYYLNKSGEVVKGRTTDGVTAEGNFFPFNGSEQSGNAAVLNYGFAMRMDIEFRLTEEGTVLTTEGEAIPIEFNFSGDDDVWIFIDGKLALDIGGDHDVVTGSLNFKDMRYRVSAVKNSSGGGCTPNVEGDFELGAQEIHTLTMFYMERGLWESNMDLLNPNVPLDLSDENWKIYSRNPVMPPHYVAKDAHVQNSLVAEGCNVYGEIDFAVLFAGVYVAPGAVVKDSIVMPGARIEEGARVQYAIVAENSVVGAGAVVGERPEDMENKDDWGVAVIGPGCNIAPGTVVPPKAMIDAEEENK